MLLPVRGQPSVARGLCVASGFYFFLPLVTVASFPVPTQLGFSIAGDVATYAGLLRFHRFVQAAITQWHANDPSFLSNKSVLRECPTE